MTSRRDFLKTAGGVAGAAALSYFMPVPILRAAGDEAVFASSALASPSFSNPVIIKGTGPLEFLKLDNGLEIVSARLSGAKTASELSLSLKSTAGNIITALPDTPVSTGLYDLYLTISRNGKTRTEKQPHTVRVVNDFKKNFSFGVVSDVHFGDPRISAKVKGFDTEKTFKGIIDQMNDAGVEFCLCCGDLSFIPPKTKSELMQYAGTIVENADFLIYTVPGNHDGYTSGAGGKISFDTLKYFESTFGAGSYSASYGDIAIIGINTYDKPAADRNLYGGHVDTVDCGAMSEEQLAWLDAAMKSAREKYKTVILIGHHNPTNTVKDVNGPFVVVPFSETGRQEFLSLIEKHKPDIFFVGHVHGIHEEAYGNTRIITAPTAGSMPDAGNPIGFYMVDVVDSAVSKINTIEIARL